MKLRVAEICKNKNMTLKELSDRLGISNVGLSQQINGNPTIETLEKIALALDVSIHELFVHNGIVGIIKAKGQVFEINSIEDLKNAIKTIE